MLTPEPETVIVAVLAVVPVFEVYAAVIVPLPVPEAVTVHQVWSLEAVHAMFEATVKLVVPEEVETFWFEGITLNVAAVLDCVTVTV